MCKLSAPYNQLVQQLWAEHSQRGWLRHKRHVSIMLDLLARIGDCDEPVVIRQILAFVFDPDGRLGMAACQSIHRLLLKAESGDFLKLMDSFDSYSLWPNLPSAWERLRPGDMPSLMANAEARYSLVGLATFHRNGYVRHAALRELAAGTNDNILILPFILLRANDWVGPIREEAASVLKVRIADVALPTLSRYLPLVLRLLDCGRADHSELVQSSLRRLTSGEGTAQLANVVNALDRQTRRKFIRVVLDKGGSDAITLLPLGLRSLDPVIRLWSARKLIATGGEKLEQTLIELSADNSMPVRREALRARASIHTDKAIAIWSSALLDKHRSIRELARFHLSKLGESNSVDVYRDALAAGRNLLTAIYGISETGSPADIPVVLPFVAASKARLRQAAIRTLAALADDEVISTYVAPRLADDSPCVIRAASDALIQHPAAINGEDLCALAESGGRAKTGSAVLDVLDASGKWEALPFLIRLSATGGADVADKARALVTRWFTPPRINKVFTTPTPQQKERIKESLRQTSAQQPGEFLRDLAEWLRPMHIVLM